MHRLALWPVADQARREGPDRRGVGLETRPTEQSIRETFKRFPKAGVGLLLGPEAGIIDIECDGPEGEDSLAKLMGGEIVLTLGWSSARGPHHVFRYDARLARYGKSIIKRPELPGLEIRIGGNGKQLQSNCPPTIGTDGKPREWNGNWIVADLPEAFFSFLDAALSQAGEQHRRRLRQVSPAAWPHRRRDAYATKALEDECQAVALAADGEQNETLNTAAFNLGQLVGRRRAGSLERRTAVDGGRRRLCPQGRGRRSPSNDPVRPGRWPEAAPRPVAPGSQPERPVDEAVRGQPPPRRPGRRCGSPSCPAWSRFRSMSCPPRPPGWSGRGRTRSGVRRTSWPSPRWWSAAGAIGRSASLLLKPDYFASTMLFAACVGPPSDGKTPALKAVARAIRRIDEALADEHAAEMGRWEQLATPPAASGKKPPPHPKALHSRIA